MGVTHAVGMPRAVGLVHATGTLCERKLRDTQMPRGAGARSVGCRRAYAGRGGLGCRRRRPEPVPPHKTWNFQELWSL